MQPQQQPVQPNQPQPQPAQAYPSQPTQQFQPQPNTGTQQVVNSPTGVNPAWSTASPDVKSAVKAASQKAKIFVVLSIICLVIGFFVTGFALYIGAFLGIYGAVMAFQTGKTLIAIVGSIGGALNLILYLVVRFH